jgi:hypothetical protein
MNAEYAWYESNAKGSRAPDGCDAIQSVLPVSLRGAMAGWLKAELKAGKNGIVFLVLAMTATARHKCRFDPRPASPTSWRELPSIRAE